MTNLLEQSFYTKKISFTKPVLIWGENEDRIILYKLLLESTAHSLGYLIEHHYTYDSLTKALSPSLFETHQKTLYIVNHLKEQTLSKLPPTPDVFIFANTLKHTSKLFAQPQNFISIEAYPWRKKEKLDLAHLFLENTPNQLTDEEITHTPYISTLKSTKTTNVSRETFTPNVGSIRKKIFALKTSFTRLSVSKKPTLQKIEALMQAEKQLKTRGKISFEHKQLLLAHV